MLQRHITPYRAHAHKRYSSMNCVPEHDLTTFFALHRTKCKPIGLGLRLGLGFRVRGLRLWLGLGFTVMVRVTSEKHFRSKCIHLHFVLSDYHALGHDSID